MPYPTQITDHAEQALTRLTRLFRDKPGINGLLTCISSRRLTVLEAVEARRQYWVTLNGQTFAYDAAEGDTAGDVAAALVAKILAGETEERWESFEAFDAGDDLDGQGVLTWSQMTAFGTLPFCKVTAAFAYAGSKSFRATYPEVTLSVNVGAPAFDNGANLANFRGNTDAIQYLSLRFRMPVGWPSYVGPDTPDLMPIAWLYHGAGPARIYALQTSHPFADFNLIMADIGSVDPPIMMGPFTLSTVADGEWHELTIEHDLAGTYDIMEIDGTIGGTFGSVIGAIPAPNLAFVALHDQVATAGTTCDPVYIDRVQINGVGAASDEFLAWQPDAESERFYVSKPSAPGIELAVTSDSLLPSAKIGPVDQLQEIETVLFDILTKRDLDNAEGVQLDRLGGNLGLTRGGLDDTNYRRLLRVQVQTNLSRGEPERLIRTFSEFTGSLDVFLQEYFPGLVIISGEVPAVNEAATHNAMERVAAAGVRLTLISTTDTPFGFDGDATALGFDDLTGLVGGEFSHIF